MIDIKALIKQKGMTVQECADKLGITADEFLQAEKEGQFSFKPCHSLGVWLWLEDMSERELSVRSGIMQNKIAKFENGTCVMTEQEKRNLAISLGIEPENIKEIVSGLEAIRLSKSISRQTLGAAVGKSAIYIARLEKGDLDIAYLYARHPEEIQMIADFLGVTVAEIL